MIMALLLLRRMGARNGRTRPGIGKCEAIAVNIPLQRFTNQNVHWECEAPAEFFWDLSADLIACERSILAERSSAGASLSRFCLITF